MNVSVFGLGYVGTVLTACLSRGGHHVYGVDINPQKVRDLDAGISPIEEAGVGELIEAGAGDGRIRATTEPAEAIAESTVSFVTVGTPLDDTGRLSTTNLYNVMDSIARPLETKSSHTIVIRSTVPPGTTRNLRSYLNARIDGSTGVDFAVNPEFLREGTALDDFYDPPYVVVGTFEDTRVRAVVDLYRSLDVQADVEVVTPELAESLKMVNNAFHALKICFANEIGSIATAVGVDGKQLLELVCEDTKLNISEKYLEPGFAFGGACLPKDTRAISNLGEDVNVSTPLLESIPGSNDQHLARVRETVRELDADTVGILGISFKSGTMDLRNSPGLRLATMLDAETLLYAGDIELSEVVGSNRDYLTRTVPDLDSALVEDSDAFFDRIDAVVITNDGEYRDLVPQLESKAVCDPVGAVKEFEDDIDEYHSITW